jgi:hypothetical protein
MTLWNNAEYAEDGVDVSLIRWMLSLTPAERLAQLDDFVDFVIETRRLNPDAKIPEHSQDTDRTPR